jgi:hypothetical protein
MRGLQRPVAFYDAVGNGMGMGRDQRSVRVEATHRQASGFDQPAQDRVRDVTSSS